MDDKLTIWVAEVLKESKYLVHHTDLACFLVDNINNCPFDLPDVKESVRLLSMDEFENQVVREELS